MRKLFAIALLLLPAMSAAQAPTAGQPDSPPPAKKPNWKEMSGVVTLAPDPDPLGHILWKMGESADLLAKLQTSDPTQAVQTKIIIDLDAFIAEIEKKKKKKSGGGGDPNNPLPDSILAGGPGGQGDLKDPNASARLWGQLPAKERQQILQSQNEGFPAGYEAVLSSYYKHLAQENVGETGPTTRPARQP